MTGRIAFAPLLPNLSFEITQGQRLAERAAEVYSAHFRRAEKEDKDFILPVSLTDHRPRSWVTSLDVDVHPKQQWPKPASLLMMLGGGEEEVSGRGELEKIARCLDRLYPDELERAVLRDAEVNELSRLLTDVDRRPVLLVGPPRVGKTAIIQEHVFREVQRDGLLPRGKGGVWLVAPQRLISGMAYVGQWENRLLAILGESQKNTRVLYFDDMLGLFTAGLTSQSDLSAAHVLRPFIERRDVRVVAEITPEALRILRERDRGFADLFQILPVAEPPERDTRRILIEVSRQLEGQHCCAFSFDVLPAATDLQRRYVRELAMPGKVAGFLRQLAVKYANGAIDRQTVIREFHARSGLSLQMLDPHRRLERKEVIGAIGKDLIGQPAAVDAMADAVCVAKARLNDPGRPLASMLFLGPTGVGKTQAAKALATYLFGDPDRLLRFDMNEYLDGYSVSRLVGTFGQPDGLLTGRGERQPFCVILLDEIEKAHPAVFDLLLQVLGEGRLTDAHGRTADFSNAIVVLTSNLGVRESGRDFGLRPAAPVDRDETFIAAAESFFRPEFFNRLDRIVPFRPLSRADVERIANGLIRSVFERDGLLSRRCLLRLEPEAMERIVQAGFHPQLGARALNRAIERQLTRPVATTLASIAPGTPTLIDVHAAGSQLAVRTRALQQVQSTNPAPLDVSDPEAVLECVLDAVDRIDASQTSASTKVLTQGELHDEHFRMLAISDQAGRVRRAVQRTFEKLDASRVTRPPLFSRVTRRSPRTQRKVGRSGIGPHKLFSAMMAADDVNQYLADLAGGASDSAEDNDATVENATAEAALLNAMADPTVSGRVLLHLRPLGDEPESSMATLVAAYGKLFDRHYGFTCERVQDVMDRTATGKPADALQLATVLLFEFPGAEKLVAREAGTHLFIPSGAKLGIIQVMAIPLSPGENPITVARAHLAAHERWRHEIAAGRAGVSDDPWPLRPVVRVYDGNDVTVDLATGLVSSGGGGPLTAHDLRAFVVGGLSLPPEVAEFS